MRDPAADRVAPPAPVDESWGWYLYGITRNTEQAAERTGDGVDLSVPIQADGHELGEAITVADLVAVVRRVPLAEFAPEALRAQAEDPAWLEAAARRHNAVIETVHRTRTILPAKFASVYAHEEDVRTALVDERNTLLARLNWIEGCDEWGVRLFGEVDTIRQRADEEQESVRRLREDLASASPGRAYFLQRKLADERVGAVERFLDELTGQAYEHFGRFARAGQVTRRLSGSRVTDVQHTAELLRAAFLVPRELTGSFIEEVVQFSESQSGLWCDYSGPWPPYSFAAQAEEA